MKKLVISCIIFLSCLLVGCSNNFLISTGSTDLDPKKIHINFNAFSKTDTKEINTVSIDEIDLSELTNEEIINIKQIISTAYDTLGKYEYLIKNLGSIDSYYKDVAVYFDTDFYNLLLTGDNAYIYKTMIDLYKIPDTNYYKTNVIAIRKSSNANLEVDIQILAIKDNKQLYGKLETIIMKSDYKIKNIKSNSDFVEIKNSTTPLNETNFSDTNKRFQEKLKSLLSSISNKYLYENYHALETGTIEYKTKEEKLEKEKEINLQIDTLLEKDNLNTDVLRSLFLTGEGTFEKYGIVSYYLKNNENTEESIYKVGFIHNKEIKYFNFTYSRLLDAITNVEEINEN